MRKTGKEKPHHASTLGGGQETDGHPTGDGVEEGNLLPTGPAGTFGHRDVTVSRGGWHMATSDGYVPMPGCNRWSLFDYDPWLRGGKTRLHLQIFGAIFGLIWGFHGALSVYIWWSDIPHSPHERFSFPAMGLCTARPAHGLFGRMVGLQLKRILVGVMRSCDDFTCTLPAQPALQGPLPSWLADAAGSDQAGKEGEGEQSGRGGEPGAD